MGDFKSLDRLHWLGYSSNNSDLRKSLTFFKEICACALLLSVWGDLNRSHADTQEVTATRQEIVQHITPHKTTTCLIQSIHAFTEVKVGFCHLWRVPDLLFPLISSFCAKLEITGRCSILWERCQSSHLAFSRKANKSISQMSNYTFKSELQLLRRLWINCLFWWTEPFGALMLWSDSEALKEWRDKIAAQFTKLMRIMSILSRLTMRITMVNL